MSASLVFFKCQVIGVIVKKKYLMKNKKSNRLYKGLAMFGLILQYTSRLEGQGHCEGIYD